MKLRTTILIASIFIWASLGHSQEMPSVGITSIGTLVGSTSITSSEGEQIQVVSLAIGDRSDGPRFYLQAGLHADEFATTEFALWLASRIKKKIGPLTKLPSGSVVDIVPRANPDTKSRYNANGINLNRNFSVLHGQSREPEGPRPFSEPETAAIRELFRARNYVGAIDVHGFVNWVVMPSPPATLGKRLPGNYSQWAGALTQITRKLPGYIQTTPFALGDGGAFEDWAFWDAGVPAVCLEMISPQRWVKGTDMYLAYEEFIYKTYLAAYQIKRGRKINDAPNSLARTSGGS